MTLSWFLPPTYIQKEAVALYSWTKPIVSLIDSPSAKLSKLRAGILSLPTSGIASHFGTKSDNQEVILIGDSDDEEPLSSPVSSVSGKKSPCRIKPTDEHIVNSEVLGSKQPLTTSSKTGGINTTIPRRQTYCFHQAVC